MILSPEWFFGYDIVFELLFAVVTLIVALFAFKVYRITSHKQPFYLGWAFLLISISNFLQSIMNLLIITEMNENICGAIKFQSVTLFNTIGLYLHMFFMILGLALLAFMTLRSRNTKILLLLMLLSLMAVFFSANPLYMFYLISSLLLMFIAWYFIKNYLKNKQTKTLLVAIAFLFLLFGSIHFFFAVNHQLFYVIAHFLELVAYALILTNFFMVLKNE